MYYYYVPAKFLILHDLVRFTLSLVDVPVLLLMFSTAVEYITAATTNLRSGRTAHGTRSITRCSCTWWIHWELLEWILLQRPFIKKIVNFCFQSLPTVDTARDVLTQSTRLCTLSLPTSSSLILNLDQTISDSSLGELHSITFLFFSEGKLDSSQTPYRI